MDRPIVRPRVTVPHGAGDTSAPVHAFEAWLGRALGRSGPLTSEELEEGVARFELAAAGTTFVQTKVALAQVVVALQAQRPEAVNAFGARVLDKLLLRTGELPQEDRAREEAELREGRFEVPLEVPIPGDAFEAVTAAVGDPAEELRALFDRLDADELPPSVAAAKLGWEVTALAGAPREATPGVAAAESVTKVRCKVSPAQWGAFLGRAISNALEPEERTLLARLAGEGVRTPTLDAGLELSGLLRTDADRAWATGVSAAFALAKATQWGGSVSPLLTEGVTLLSKSDATPRTVYVPLRSLEDGDLEALLFRWVGTELPGLKKAVALHHPHIPEPEQLVGTAGTLEQVACEQGRFLEGFNVLTVMHQMGRTVPWLNLLESKLGLRKENYLGVSVPYSGAQLALARLNLEGWTTWDDHDPREPFLAQLQDRLGAGNPRSFDDLKEAEVERAVKAMLAKHAQNGKPILVVDDGGYVARVISRLPEEQRRLFRLVEWTTRGIRQFEALDPPPAPLVSGAESRPKVEVEPAFIAASVAEHFEVAMKQRFGGLAGKRVLVVGFGNIGRAVAKTLKGKRAKVSITDLDERRLRRAAKERFPTEADVTRAVKGQEAILAVTGANSLPPDVLAHADSGTYVASASSVDIETRAKEQRQNGHWSVPLKKVRLNMRPGPAPRDARRNGGPLHPVNQVWFDTLQRELGRSLAPYGMYAELEETDIAQGGFVLNLSRRVRSMPLEHEDLITMIMSEAMAQAVDEAEPGKHALATHRGDRVVARYAEVHPEAYADAVAFHVEVA